MHDIYNRGFYGARSNPAWHKLNILNELNLPDVDRSAREVLTLIGEPIYSMESLSYEVNGTRYPSNSSVLIRHPQGNETQPALLGTVSNDYHPIYPGMAADEWDKRTGLCVETLAFLRLGAKIFITGKMPQISVMGTDDVQNYLVMYIPINGHESAQGFVTPVRVVCQNTLTTGLNNTVSSFRIRHSEGGLSRLGSWLERTYQGALSTINVLQQAYGQLARTRVNLPEVQWIADTVYKMPRRPDANTPRKMDYAMVLEAYEYRRQWVSRARNEVVTLFSGKGRGSEYETAKGTAWGALNAVAEFATFRRGTVESLAHNVINGDRAREIRKGYELCLELAKQ